MSYIKQNFLILATTCKRLHVDNLNGPVGPFRVRSEIKEIIFFIRTQLFLNVRFFTTHSLSANHIHQLVPIFFNAKWSYGRTIQVIDMRSFASSLTEKRLKAAGETVGNH